MPAALVCGVVWAACSIYFLIAPRNTFTTADPDSAPDYRCWVIAVVAVVARFCGFKKRLNALAEARRVPCDRTAGTVRRFGVAALICTLLNGVREMHGSARQPDAGC